jgi:hypothetical protein
MTSLYNVTLEDERDLASVNARSRREEAIALELKGQRIAADIFRLAARMYDDSARFWEQERRRLEALLHVATGASTDPEPLADGSGPRVRRKTSAH